LVVAGNSVRSVAEIFKKRGGLKAIYLMENLALSCIKEKPVTEARTSGEDSHNRKVTGGGKKKKLVFVKREMTNHTQGQETQCG